MDEVVGALLALTRKGVQVFLATHSYIILREIEVQSSSKGEFRFFAIERTKDGIDVNPSSTYLGLQPNAIETQYASLYDRNIDKRIREAVN